MKITYYGTGAGEAWPGVFCQCPTCQAEKYDMTASYDGMSVRF